MTIKYAKEDDRIYELENIPIEVDEQILNLEKTKKSLERMFWKKVLDNPNNTNNQKRRLAFEDMSVESMEYTSILDALSISGFTRRWLAAEQGLEQRAYNLIMKGVLQ
jgi:hypothetical protein